MALAETIVHLIIALIVLLIVAAILNGMSKGIIRNRYAGSFGRAFVVVLIGVLAWYTILNYAIPFLEDHIGPFGLVVGLLLIWFIYAAIITGFYHTSFGRGLAVAILLAIVTALIYWVFWLIFEVTLLPFLIALGLI